MECVLAWDTERQQADDGTVEVNAWDEYRPNDRFLTRKIDRSNERIEFYPTDASFEISPIILKGFTSLPQEFKEAGYTRSVGYYLDKKLSGRKLRSLTISKEQDDLYRKVPKGDKYDVVLKYETLRRLKEGMTAISSEAKQERSSLADEFFAELLPAARSLHRYLALPQGDQRSRHPSGT